METWELQGRIQAREAGLRRAEVENQSRLEDIRRRRAQVVHGSQQLQGAMARIEELDLSLIHI
eukprot:6467417-Alexandrium_andersonii.AAC.1